MEGRKQVYGNWRNVSLVPRCWLNGVNSVTVKGRTATVFKHSM